MTHLKSTASRISCSPPTISDIGSRCSPSRFWSRTRLPRRAWRKALLRTASFVGEVPGDYIATIELFDETAKSSTNTDIEFAIVPNRTTGAHQGRDQSGEDENKRL